MTLRSNFTPQEGLCCTVSCSESLEVSGQSRDIKRKNKDDGKKGKSRVVGGSSSDEKIK